MPRLATLDDAPPQQTPQERVLHEARVRYQRGIGHPARKRWVTRADEAYKFVSGDQWPEGLLTDRDNEGTPSLTINVLRQHALLVANAIRQNRPAQIVGPVDDQGDPQTAETIQGLLRHIEYESEADTAYDAAAWNVVVTGLGYLLTRARYETPGSFDQTLAIDAVHDPRAVVYDPASLEPTGRDAEWCFLVRRLPWETLKLRWPQSRTAQDHTAGEDWNGLGHGVEGWTSPDDCQVADYWTREWHSATLSRVPAGLLTHPAWVEWTQDALSVTPVGDGLVVDVLHERPLPAGAPQDVQQRPTRVPLVMHYQMTAHEILEQETWSANPQADPEGWLPLVRVVGVPMLTTEGIVYDGLILPGSDGQRFLNFGASAVAEAIGMAPKAPYVGYAGTMDRPEWGTANIIRHAHLDAIAYPDGWPRDGAPAPLPQRAFGEPPIQAASQAFAMGNEMLKQVTGQFDPSRGQESGDRSGKAIRLLQSQGQTSTFHYGDNLHKAIRQTCRVHLVQIPQRFDAARVARIIGEDGTPRTVALNQPTTQHGQPAFFDVTVGRYDLVANAGPSYQTKQQEAQENLPPLVQAMPVIGTAAPDLVIRATGGAYSDQIADRVKRLVEHTTPWVLGPSDHDEQAQTQGQGVPPAVQAQLQQMHGEMQKMGAALADKQADVALKREEIAARRYIAEIGAAATLAAARLKLDGGQDAAELEAALEHAAALRDQDHATQTANADRLHDVMTHLTQHHLARASAPAPATIPAAQTAEPTEPVTEPGGASDAEPGEGA